MGFLKILFKIAFCFAIILCIGMFSIAMKGYFDNIQKSDVGIVLGSQVNPGGVPSERLKARLDRAASLYHQRMFPVVIVSGGKGIEGFDEATVMKNYLVSHGVLEKNIIMDSSGINTIATAKNTAQIMKEKGFKSAFVVTQYFHIPRTILAMQAYGIGPIYHAHATFFEARDIYSLGREAVAMPVYSAKLQWAKP